jgi:hypothetical protein
LRQGDKLSHGCSGPWAEGANPENQTGSNRIKPDQSEKKNSRRELDNQPGKTFPLAAFPFANGRRSQPEWPDDKWFD